MHAVLQELESRQLLVRRTHPQHRRVLQTELTEGGRETLRAAADAVDAVEERMLGKLSGLGRSRLAGALSSCVDALTDAPPSSVSHRPR
jgi:DNA-binding MarR family transcriptional regulator